MRYRSKLLEKCSLAIAFAVGALFFFIPFASYRVWESRPQAYENSRVIAASLSAAVAAFVAVAAWTQYRKNSRDQQIERSMSFWRRSNEMEFLRYYNRANGILANTGPEVPITASLANSHQASVAIDFILDFYDEACAAVIIGACDEVAMCFYLGPMMMRHHEIFSKYIEELTASPGQRARWDSYLALVDRWKGEPSFKEMMGPLKAL